MRPFLGRMVKKLFRKKNAMKGGAILDAGAASGVRSCAVELLAGTNARELLGQVDFVGNDALRHRKSEWCELRVRAPRSDVAAVVQSPAVDASFFVKTARGTKASVDEYPSPVSYTHLTLPTTPYV